MNKDLDVAGCQKRNEAVNSSLFPKIAIIVLNWNGKENTCECLESLRYIDYRNYEIIVVDNASTDGSQKFLEKNFPGVLLVKNKKNLGFGGGLNVGIIEAIGRGADYVLCLNNDVVVDKDILTELVKVGEIGTEIGGLCPMEYDYNQPNRIICAGGVARFFLGKVFGYGESDKGQFNKVRETWLLSGPAMMLKIHAILDVGTFDTSYFYGPEDKDIALRFMKKGYKLMFVPTAKLWHKGSGATGGKITPLIIYFSVRNRILFARKHANTFKFAIFIMYFWILEFPFTLLKCLTLRKEGLIRAAVNGVIWHLNRNLVPTDPVIVNSNLKEQ